MNNKVSRVCVCVCYTTLPKGGAHWVKLGAFSETSERRSEAYLSGSLDRLSDYGCGGGLRG